LQINRVQLYTDLNQEINFAQLERYDRLIELRLQGEPVAYITGHKEFYELDFYVDSRVLIPRPESELLVELALAYAQEHPVSNIADVGTGSGAIAISLAIHLPQVRIYAIDLSTAALNVARINMQKHGVNRQITLLEGNLLQPLPLPADLIVANLPYVRKTDLSAIPSARYEPALALDGGESGLDQIYQLCHQIDGKLQPAGCLLLEIGMGQGLAVAACLRRLYPSAQISEIPDLASIGRVIRFTFGE
jgi:release factor glutamine methyltransferase